MLEQEEKTENNIQEEENIKIYSKRAIWAFSILFSPLFGGVLLMQNIKDVYDKKEIYKVLIFCILFTLLTIVANQKFGQITLVFNIVGGLMLTEFFYPKYFPNDLPVEHKKIWKPLIISLIITIPLVIIAVLSLKGQL